MRTLPVCGLDLEVDEGGRVDLTAIHRRDPAIQRSPSEWARTRPCRELMRDLMSDPRTRLGDIWRIDGTTKQARTWVHPRLAEAYIRGLGVAAAAPADLAREVADLRRRVADIELQILGWGEGLE